MSNAADGASREGRHVTRASRQPPRAARLLSAILLLALAALAAPAQAQSDAGGEWRSWGADTFFTRYSPLDQISADNVAELRVAWRWETTDRELQESNPLWRAGRNEDTPLMVNGVLYTVTGLGLVAALDPGSGETRWVYDPESYAGGRSGAVGFIQRGLGYWTDGTAERVLVGTIDAHLVSLDARTGQPDESFGDGGRVDLLVGVPRASRDGRRVAARRPLIAGDVAVIGSSISDRPANREMPPGAVHGFDIRTGRRLWTFFTVPREFEAGYETWLGGSAQYSGNANVWAGMAYDPELDYVYLPTSTPTNDYYGGLRPGDNLFAESLVCLEAQTGRRGLAFPGGAPRPVGLRLRLDAGAGRHHRRRPSRQGGHPGEQAGVRLRLRPGHRRAGLADRGAAGGGVDRAGRMDRADPAVSDAAGGVRSAGRNRGEPDRFHPGAAAPGPGTAAGVRPRPALHAAIARRHPDTARHRRRGELARRDVRSGDRPLLRRLPHEPVAGQGILRRPGALRPALPRAGGRPGPGRRGRRGGRRGPDDGGRAAAVQTAVLPGHGHRHAQRRPPLDGAARQRPREPSAVAGSGPASARRRLPPRQRHGDQDAAVRQHVGGALAGRSAARGVERVGRFRRRAEPGLHLRQAVGRSAAHRAAGGLLGCRADDLRARRAPVRRRGDWVRPRTPHWWR